MLEESSARLEASFEFDVPAGEVRDGDIRYLLMRPDVLMGMFSKLTSEDRQQALQALEQSAYENGQASMRVYRELEFSNSDEMLRFFCASAARLGWGNFSYELGPEERLAFVVTNSAFAAGYGESDAPVCASITGILRAFVEVFFGRSVLVQEVECAALGSEVCRFEVLESPQERQR